MPNELLFIINQEITKPPPPPPLILGQVLVAPYDRIRVYAVCGEASRGSVEVTLDHIIMDEVSEVELLHSLDSFILAPGSSVTQVYDVPGVILRISAHGTAIEDPLAVDVVIWGFRSSPGSPPQTPFADSRKIGTLVVYAVQEAKDGGAKPPNNGGKNGGTTTPNNGGKNGGTLVNAGANVIISLDAWEVGRTDDSGMVRVDRLEGGYQLGAERDNLYGGATAEIVPGEETTLQVVLKPSEPGQAG